MADRVVQDALAGALTKVLTSLQSTSSTRAQSGGGSTRSATASGQSVRSDHRSDSDSPDQLDDRDIASTRPRKKIKYVFH